jgi:ribonuclease T2
VKRAFLLISAILITLSAGSDAAARGHGRADRQAAPQAEPGRFDYYVASLSWSPTYCATHPDDDEQCRRKRYGFVLHGLWPQYDRGGGPENCLPSAGPGRRTIDDALAFMPSRGLIRHEWRSHGSCSGLDAARYFALADRAHAALRIPPDLATPRTTRRMSGNDLRAALRRANPGLRDDMVILHCRRDRLTELRVCLDKDLDLRRCGSRMRNTCPAERTFLIPAAR